MWLVGTVRALHDETASARKLTLEVADWPGRAIVSEPKSEKRSAITVERLREGEVSPYLTQQLIVGDQLEIRGPIGGWFPWRPTGPRNLRFADPALNGEPRYFINR